MPATSTRKDPFASFRFRVDIQGMQAGFAEVNGLATETDLVEFRTGREDTARRNIPGLRKYADLTFKRGYTNSRALWKWHQQTIKGTIRRLPGSITVLDEQRKPAQVWKFHNGKLTKFVAPDLNPKGTDVAIEELELRVEGLKLTKTSGGSGHRH